MIMTSYVHSSETSHRELGIILLPDNQGREFVQDATKNLKSQFQKGDVGFSEVPNSPHVSIFQGVFSIKNLAKLKSALEGLASSLSQVTVTVDPNLQDTQENIFLNFVTNDVVNLIISMFFDNELYKLRDASRLMRQVKRDIDSGLSQDNQGLVEKYGLYWNVPEKGHNPHFTIVYGSNEHQGITGILKKMPLESQKITFTKIAIGVLGFDGNVEEIIASYDLR